MKTLDIPVLEFATRWEAMQHVQCDEGRAILLHGKPVVVLQEDADRLEVAGVSFANLAQHAIRDGSYRVMTIPVN
jgi:hypothetical protein